MKYRNINACLTSFFLLASLSGCATKNPLVEGKNFELFGNGMTTINTLKASFIDGEKQIPYLNMDDIPTVLNLQEQVPTIIEKDSKTETVLMKRNNETALFDFANDMIYVTNLNTIGGTISRPNNVDVLSITKDINDTETKNPLAKDLANSKYTFRNSSIIDLSRYNIDLVFIDNKAYIPYQTFTDIFLTRQQLSLAFNGDMFATNPQSVNASGQDFYKKWFKNEKVQRSQKLAEYSYHELCLNLDMNYGLKRYQHIDSFDTYFGANDLKVKLLSLDPVVSSNALCDFICKNLDDLHSSFLLATPFVGGNTVQPKAGTSMEYLVTMNTYYSSLFSGYFGLTRNPKLPWYAEEGDTAFVYFQTFNFSLDSMASYYDENLKKPENEFWWVEKNDTLGLVQYAHKQVTREGSPIKKVVVDLTLNTGGYVDAGAYVLSWLIGYNSSKVRLASQDTYINATALTAVSADVNLDGNFDSKDMLFGNNIVPYVLISPISFSCGNYVPAIIKSTSRATLIGRTTSGGTCGVLPTSLADGTLFNISGPFMVSTYKNGLFYDVDKGVEPDVVIDDPTNLYSPKTVIESGVEKNHIPWNDNRYYQFNSLSYKIKLKVSCFRQLNFKQSTESK